MIIHKITGKISKKHVRYILHKFVFLKTQFCLQVLGGMTKCAMSLLMLIESELRMK